MLYGSERSDRQRCTASKIDKHSPFTNSQYTSIVVLIITRTRTIMALLVLITIEAPQTSNLYGNSSVSGFYDTGN
jgi:hypothetical protein